MTKVKNTPAKAAAHPLFETLDVTVSLDDQDVNFTGLLKVDGHKVRLRIRSNAYAFQSHARAEIWSAASLKWNEVANIGHGSMQTPAGLYSRTSSTLRPGLLRWNDLANFKADADRLLALVAATLL